MLSVMDFLDTAPTIEEVDKKISDMRNDIHVLEQYRNARLLVVSRLPPEVLCTIFEYMALAKHDSNTTTTGSKPYAWLSVTQVCRLWRNTALSNPRMWGCIYNRTSLDLAKLFLERAKSAPLYYRTQSYPYCYDEAKLVALVLGRPGQLKEFDVLLKSLDELTVLSQHQFPLLETLCVRVDSNFLQGPPRRIVFSPDADGGTPPPLRKLILENCYVDLEAQARLSRLAVLNLTYTGGSLNKPNIPMANLLAALSKMEWLTSLKLVNVVGASGVTKDGSVTRLPRLSSLHIAEMHVDSLSIITHIICPSVQTVVASATEIVTPSDPLTQSIARTFYSLLPGDPSAWKTTLHVQIASRVSKTTVAIWPDPNVRPNDDGTSPPPSRLTIFGGRNDYATYSFLSPLLPTTNPFTLDLHYGFDKTADGALLTFLRTLENVEELRIDDFSTLVSILLDTPPPNKGKTKARIPSSFSLPSVKSVELHQNDRIKYKERLMKKLRKLLDARKAVGAGIEVLKIRSAPFTEEKDDLDALRGQVKTVEILPYVAPMRMSLHEGCYLVDLY